MTAEVRSDQVVVGVDGSAAGLAAARWAAAEAARRTVPLRVVQVQEPLPTGVAWVALSARDTACDLAWGAQTVRDAVRQSRAVAPQVEVTGEVIFGNVVTGLLAAGAQSQQLVVGSYSILPRSLRRSSSYVAAVIGRSQVPVTVVEPVADGRTISPTVAGPVVVLTDTMAGVDRLADYGCAQARLGQTSVEIVTLTAGKRRGHTDRFSYELELFDALVSCRSRWPAVSMTGLVAFADQRDAVGSLLSRASLLVMDAKRGRRLLRRVGTTGPLSIRTCPRALTYCPTGATG
jgi:nucleotide-binding universal stress UspA family protein